MFKKLRERFRVTMLIREAIDTYPDGICFAAAGGRPILSNRKINEICYKLTGHTVTNADRMWEELEALRFPVNTDRTSSDDGVEQILCRLRDGQVWQFQRRRLLLDSGPVIQYEAANVSVLYRYQTELRKKNEQLSFALERQRILLQSIVENNLKKELLHTKMRIHADFGKLLAMTESRLLSADEDGDDSEIFLAWDNLITDMENASMVEETTVVSPQVELRKIAALIGCSIELTGSEPKERKVLLLLYAAIREALMNAVRHAGADLLRVEILHEEGRCKARISSNGRSNIKQIREGGGLSDLRRRLEQDGAMLLMQTDDGVVMHVTIPEGENKW